MLRYYIKDIPNVDVLKPNGMTIHSTLAIPLKK
jgi:hypothetical protein